MILVHNQLHCGVCIDPHQSVASTAQAKSVIRKPLPGKKVLTQLNRYASDFVDRRCSGLQTFLRKSASHPVLSGDNDLVAFLTLPHAPFQMYMQWNSLDSSILSLVGLRTPATPSPPQNQRLLANASTDDRVETPVDPLSVGGRGSHLARVSGSTVSGRSSQSILQASEVFTRYQSEVREKLLLVNIPLIIFFVNMDSLLQPAITARFWARGISPPITVPLNQTTTRCSYQGSFRATVFGNAHSHVVITWGLANLRIINSEGMSLRAFEETVKQTMSAGKLCISSQLQLAAAQKPDV
uniref:PX domain-containing protein n=1 Tax=Mesocestoides corti TaxID=53468 RepID=A0A5K3FKH8_MESCO